VLDRA
jgi:hypothetical protein